MAVRHCLAFDFLAVAFGLAVGAETLTAAQAHADASAASSPPAHAGPYVLRRMGTSTAFALDANENSRSTERRAPITSPALRNFNLRLRTRRASVLSADRSPVRGARTRRRRDRDAIRR
jgi:hypothetical protein